MEPLYHQLEVNETLEKLKATPDGLAGSEVKRRQEEYGLNKLPQPKGKTFLQIFIGQFLNPLIYILIIAAVVSILIGDYKDAIFIFLILMINASLGTHQEWKAESSASALRNMIKVRVRVRRDGHVKEVDSEGLVPGDVVLLESGHLVPADLRLLEAQDLAVEEALLTGESIAVMKQTAPLQGGPELSIGDRVNLLFAGTTVQKGRGIAVVFATADKTEMGKIADSLKTTQAEKPPLVNRMEAFSKRISVIILGACIVLGLISYFEGMTLQSIFFMMVAVGVAAIPEGLPVGMTVALSIGTKRMARRNVIVRKLPAVEGLGSCTLIASDKTGTLTMDQQSVRRLYLPDGRELEVTGQGYNGDGKINANGEELKELDEPLYRLLQANILSNEATLDKREDGGWEHSGDAVDVALLALAYKAGQSPGTFHKEVEVVKMVPYESENKFSAVFFRHKGELQFAMKGAMEVIAERLDGAEKEKYIRESEKIAAEGYRVMAMAGGKVEEADLGKVGTLELLGLIGMIDPLRPETGPSVEECKQAGIKVMMVTGDHPATALAIAKELRLAETENEVITGAELAHYEKLPVPELAEKLKHKTVCARVSPLQKQKIVEAMKSAGHYVAVTGDGANDAPALKSAHIGIAMGSGTDLAKEAASIIVTDDNFASIAAGVEEGRFTYENLRKIIYLLISTGAGLVVTVALSIFFMNTNQLPFIPVQLLWLNLVTNGIQDIALAFEKGDISVMKKAPRRPGESIFDRLMNLQILWSGAWIAALSFGLWYILVNVEGYSTEEEMVHARTIVVMLVVLLQNFQAINARSETKSFWKVPVKNNYLLVGGIVVAQALHISASYIPGLNNVLQLDHITLAEWLKLLPTAMSLVVVMELFKWWWRKKTGADNEVVRSDYSHLPKATGQPNKLSAPPSA